MKIDINKKYRTRDGRQVRLLCIDRDAWNKDESVVGLLRDWHYEKIFTWMSDGTYNSVGDGAEHLDLIEVQPYEDFKIDDKVLVRNTNNVSWIKRHFAGVDEYGRPFVFKYGMTSWTTSEVDVWDECIKAPVEDQE